MIFILRQYLSGAISIRPVLRRSPPEITPAQGRDSLSRTVIEFETIPFM